MRDRFAEIENAAKARLAAQVRTIMLSPRKPTARPARPQRPTRPAGKRDRRQYDADRRARLLGLGLCVNGPLPENRRRRPQHARPEPGEHICAACKVVHARSRGKTVRGAGGGFEYVSVATRPRRVP